MKVPTAWSVDACDHLLVQGLLKELPNVGEVFTAEERAAWVDAAVAAFNVLYPRPQGASPSAAGRDGNE